MSDTPSPGRPKRPKLAPDERERILSELVELDKEFKSAQLLYERMVDRRRTAIQAAIDAGVTYRALGAVLKISQQGVYAILKRKADRKGPAE